MKEILGINIYILGGIILLVVSIGLIIFGLKSQIPEKTYFNVSRLLALLSVAGIWYFGNILTKNTEKEITNNKLETAQAIRNTKNVELQLSKAAEELQVAKNETEELKLEVAKAHIELTKTKEKAEIAKAEREFLIERQKYIKSIGLEIKCIFETERSNISSYSPSMVSTFKILSTSVISIPNTETFVFFNLTNFAQHQREEDLREITLNYAFPQTQNEIIGKSLNDLNGELYISCNWDYKYINHLKNYLVNGRVDYEVTITVNGIKSLIYKTNKLKSGTFESGNIQFYVEKDENIIVGKLTGFNEK